MSKYAFPLRDCGNAGYRMPVIIGKFPSSSCHKHSTPYACHVFWSSWGGMKCLFSIDGKYWVYVIYLNILFSVCRGLKHAVPGVSGCFSLCLALRTFGHLFLFQLPLQTCCLGKQHARKPKGAVGNRELCQELACWVCLPLRGPYCVLQCRHPCPKGWMERERCKAGKIPDHPTVLHLVRWFWCCFLFLLGFHHKWEIANLCSRDPAADLLLKPAGFCAPGRSKLPAGIFMYFLKKDFSGGIWSNLL